MNDTSNRLKDLMSTRRGFWSRRQFLAAGSTALMPLTSPRILASAHPHATEFHLPLPIPEVLSPVRRDATTDYYAMRTTSNRMTRRCCRPAPCQAGSPTSERLQPSRAVCTRTFLFGGKLTLGVPPGVRWVINGEVFDPLRVDANPVLGDIEVWRFVNRGFMGQTMLHPVHTHLAPFQILRRNGGAPLRQEGGWKDTVAIEEGEEVDVIVRWNGYRGRYVLHCHNLEHEDHSMMSRVDVL